MRTRRIVLPGVPHHVVVRGNNRRKLFSYWSEYRRLIRELWRALERTGCRLHELTLMTNHVHMIVTPPAEKALSRFVKGACQRYAQVRNQLRDATGKLFQERFFSRPILSEEQLAVTTAYADLNPVRAGIVTDPLEYPWSTYAIHAGRAELSEVPLAMWEPSGWYRCLGPDADARASAYAQAAADYRAAGTRPQPVSDLELMESLSLGYGRRLERPDGTRAWEPEASYGPAPSEPVEAPAPCGVAWHGLGWRVGRRG